MTPDELAELRRFAAEVEEYEKAHRDPLREAAEDAEYAKLAAAYPGEHVAFLDAWDGTALTRTVLAHASRRREFLEQMGRYPREQQEQATVVYIDPPNVSYIGLCLAVECEEFDANGQRRHVQPAER